MQKILEANRRIKATAFYMKVALRYTQKTFSQVPQNVLIAMSKPVLRRVMGSPTTIFHQVKESRLPTATLSGAFRRIVRPQGKLVKNLSVEKKFSYNTTVARLNEGTITAAPPKTTPLGAPNTQEIANKILPHELPSWLLWVIKHRKGLLIISLLLFVILAIITGAFLVFAVLAIAVVAWLFVFAKIAIDQKASAALLDPKKELEQIDSIPLQPNFTLKLSDEVATPPPTKDAGGESIEGKNFRAALKDSTKRLAVTAPEKEFLPLSIASIHSKVSEAIHPHKTFSFRLSSLVRFPGIINISEPESIFPAMAYPDFEDPMYKKLTEISEELLLPNLKLIPPNTISLLKTNQKFIESYLVGLNHEMGRELLWREYPTDERGSYFRQFWDVNGVIRPAADQPPAVLTEEYKDIKPIHTWPTTSLLGTHNNRDAEGDAEQLVLVIRGDLLKRYPNTVIFAQKAIAGVVQDEPEIDRDLTNEEFAQHVKFPLYKAEIVPDIKFFGFDLTIDQARGNQPTPPFTDNLGWFFMIQEVPGEPRFGMDVSFEEGDDGLSWDDLAWTNLPADIKFITAGTTPNIDPETIKWGRDSAGMAYILFQKPSLVAVHAKEMLEKLTV